MATEQDHRKVAEQDHRTVEETANQAMVYFKGDFE